MQRATRVVSGVLACCVLILGGALLGLSSVMPDCYYVAQGESLEIRSDINIIATGLSQSLPIEVYSMSGNSYKMNLTLGGGPVIKSVDVKVVPRDMVIPGGIPFGIKMFTEGVMVVGMSDIDINGKAINPAKSAGIKTGDIVLELDNKKINRNDQVGEIVSKSKGKDILVKYSRDGVVKNSIIEPILSTDGEYRAGMWVRDSSAGIGTMTYYDPSSKVFAGLGHAICDVDTGNIMPLSSGEAVGVTITGVNKGSSGMPGELKGSFTGKSNIGNLCVNGETGVFGNCDISPMMSKPIELATKVEVTTGKAFIYATVEGTMPKPYEISIERVSTSDNSSTKNMIIKVTDPQLLAKTGGIVQGMSGSPIIQNDRLVGAVTHVFVNDPTRGYGIFAENMQKTAEQTISPYK